MTAASLAPLSVAGVSEVSGPSGINGINGISVPSAALEFPEFHYRARFATASLHPGAHRSRAAGAGLDFAASVPLARARDPRRLDLRAALRDPFGGWWAHEYRQRSSVPVLLIADVSASMRPRRSVVEAFAGALARSAQRRGDAFGLIGFASAVQAALLALPSRSRASAGQVLAALQAAPFDGRNAQAIEHAAELAPRASALGFVLSDFQFAPALLERALARLARHDVVPVWVHHAAPAADASGLLELRNAETGAWRSLWMRPALARRWAAARAAHEAAVHASLARHQRAPLRIAGARFDADAASAYFATRG